MELEACLNEEKYFKQCKNYLKNNLSWIIFLYSQFPPHQFIVGDFF
jgi:hypothetical protein